MKYESEPKLTFVEQSAPAEVAMYSPEITASHSISSEAYSKTEKKDTRNLSTRRCQLKDIPTLVDIDMRVFDNYKEYNMSDEALRADLLGKFQERYERVGSDWIRVVEKKDQIVGFMVVCPTSKTPDDFTSWEDMTDNGSLQSTYDPEGENLYVVTLSMLPGQGELAQNMLFGNQIGKMVKEGYKRAFFESRLPGFKEWIFSVDGGGVEEVGSISDQQKLDLAKQYASTKTIDKKTGKEVPLDKLMRVFDRIGCQFGEVVPNAYVDAPSLNFGIVTVYENPLSHKNRLVQKLAGTAIRAASNSKTLMKNFF